MEGQHLISVNDSRGHWGARAVILGLAIEVLLAVVFPHGKTDLENCAPVFADALVALGVWAEVHFGRKASDAQKEKQLISAERIAELNERAAQLEFESGFAEERVAHALERAANAERDTEKLRAATAWRGLSQAEHEGLALALRNSGPGASVRFCVLSDDQESLNFAQLISIPLKAAGWAVGYQFDSYLHSAMTGILLPEPQENWFEEIKLANKRVRDAFISAQISFVNGWPLQPYLTTTDNAHLAAPIVWIYVGPKPMPVT